METKDKKNYYVEPVEIEIYLKKAGKVRTIIKDMHIELIDVMPKTVAGKVDYPALRSRG